MEVMNDIEYLENWNKDLNLFDDEQEAIEVHRRCIQAFKFNSRARELLEACTKLLNKQNESPVNVMAIVYWKISQTC